MNRKEIVVIRVITTENEEFLNVHGKLIETYYPMLHTTSYCIPDQPKGIHSLESKAAAIPKIVELAKRHQDADAIVISCCDDPAVSLIRSTLPVPVIGAGESVCSLARNFGSQIGVIGITDYAPEVYKTYLQGHLINLGRPSLVSNTLDLMMDDGHRSVLDLAVSLKAKGADCIALSCTGMSTTGISREIEELCKIPVIDPVMAEGLFAYYACVRKTNI